MTSYPPALDQKYGADMAQLLQRVAMLERQVAHLASSPVTISSEQVLGASQPSITLAIPAGITWIHGVCTARKDVGGGGAFTQMRFNNDASAHYQWANTVGAAPGNSGGALVTSMQMGLCAGASDIAAYYATTSFVIGNVSSVGVAKTVQASSGLVCSGTTYYTATFDGTWNQGNALTSITLLPDAGNLVAGSSISIFGWS